MLTEKRPGIPMRVRWIIFSPTKRKLLPLTLEVMFRAVRVASSFSREKVTVSGPSSSASSNPLESSRFTTAVSAMAKSFFLAAK